MAVAIGHDAVVSVCLCIYLLFYVVHVYLCVGENTRVHVCVETGG